MNRTLAAILFLAGIMAGPLATSLVETVCTHAFAQEKEPIGSEPAPVPVSAEVFLELVKQKVKLLTNDELARESEALRKELIELQANRKLREVEQQLNQLIEQYSTSAAADRARLMLKAGLIPTPESAPTFNLIPSDDDFLHDPRGNEKPTQSKKSLKPVVAPLPTY